MRDDIHKAAPISSALQAVLKHALRPADQQRPKMLADLATNALFKELRAQLTPSLIKELSIEQQGRGLFSPIEMLGPASTRLQADVAAYLSTAPDGSLEDAIRYAASDHVRVICNESEAAMLAKGANRWEIIPGVRAFEQALLSAASTAAAMCLDARIVPIDSHDVTVKETLPLGPKAQKIRKK